MPPAVTSHSSTWGRRRACDSALGWKRKRRGVWAPLHHLCGFCWLRAYKLRGGFFLLWALRLCESVLTVQVGFCVGWTWMLCAVGAVNTTRNDRREAGEGASHTRRSLVGKSRPVLCGQRRGGRRGPREGRLLDSHAEGSTGAAGPPRKATRFWALLTGPFQS